MINIELTQVQEISYNYRTNIFAREQIQNLSFWKALKGKIISLQVYSYLLLSLQKIKLNSLEKFR